MAMILFSALALCAVATARPQVGFGDLTGTGLLGGQVGILPVNNFGRPLTGGPDASIATTGMAQEQSARQTEDSLDQTGLAADQAKIAAVMTVAADGLDEIGDITGNAILGIASDDDDFFGGDILGGSIFGNGYFGNGNFGNGNFGNGFHGNRRRNGHDRLNTGIPNSGIVDGGSTVPVIPIVVGRPVIAGNDRNTNVNNNEGDVVAIASKNNNQAAGNVDV